MVQSLNERILRGLKKRVKVKAIWLLIQITDVGRSKPSEENIVTKQGVMN